MTTQRAISYYENHLGYAPAPIVAQLAEALVAMLDLKKRIYSRSLEHMILDTNSIHIIDVRLT